MSEKSFEAKPQMPVEFIRKVGKGKSLSADLSFAESTSAFTQLLAGQFSAAQAGAFLQALRIKELSQEELNGLVSVFNSHLNPPTPIQSVQGIVLNLSSDTARKGGLLSLLAAAYLPSFGVEVALVQSEAVLTGNSKSLAESLLLAQQLVVGNSFSVFNTSQIPGLKALAAWRGELGFRSCLHTAEKMVNPWPQAPLLLGISHLHYAERLATALQFLQLNGKIILGNHGTLDLVMHKETQILSVVGKDIRMESISPSDLGLQLSAEIYALHQLDQWGTRLKDGEKNIWHALFYQLAFFLYAAGQSKNISEAWEQVNSIPKVFPAEQK